MFSDSKNFFFQPAGRVVQEESPHQTMVSVAEYLRLSDCKTGTSNNAARVSFGSAILLMIEPNPNCVHSIPDTWGVKRHFSALGEKEDGGVFALPLTYFLGIAIVHSARIHGQYRVFS